MTTYQAARAITAWITNSSAATTTTNAVVICSVAFDET